MANRKVLFFDSMEYRLARHDRGGHEPEAGMD